jgi:hypothetical protein
VYICRYQKLKFRHNLYKLREERNIKPSTFGELVSSMLYEKRCVLATIHLCNTPCTERLGSLGPQHHSSDFGWPQLCVDVVSLPAGYL